MVFGLATAAVEVLAGAGGAVATGMGALPVVAKKLSFTGLLMALSGDYTRLSIDMPPA